MKWILIIQKKIFNLHKEFLNKLSNIKTIKQKETINNLEKFYNSREEVINFFKDYRRMVLDAAYK